MRGWLPRPAVAVGGAFSKLAHMEKSAVPSRSMVSGVAAMDALRARDTSSIVARNAAVSGVRAGTTYSDSERAPAYVYVRN